MKVLIPILIGLLVVGCASTPKVVPNSPEAKAAIRKAAKKPTGELTQADLEKVTKLNLGGNKLTDVKGLEKLTKLKELYLAKNQLTNVKGLEKLWQLTRLHLHSNQLTDVKGLEKLTQLEELFSLTTPTSPKLRLLNCKRRCRIAQSTATPSNKYALLHTLTRPDARAEVNLFLLQSVRCPQSNHHQ